MRKMFRPHSEQRDERSRAIYAAYEIAYTCVDFGAALTFVVGSVLFAVASIPYLWTFANTGDSRILDGFLAWQYLVGSVLFFAGGLFNYRRAYRVVAQAIGSPTAVSPIPLPAHWRRRGR